LHVRLPVAVVSQRVPKRPLRTLEDRLVAVVALDVVVATLRVGEEAAFLGTVVQVACTWGGLLRRTALHSMRPVA